MSGSIDITPLTIAHNKKVLMMHCIHDKLPAKKYAEYLMHKVYRFVRKVGKNCAKLRKIAEYLNIKELRAFKMNKPEWKDSGFCSETGL